MAFNPMMGGEGLELKDIPSLKPDEELAAPAAVRQEMIHEKLFEAAARGNSDAAKQLTDIERTLLKYDDGKGHFTLHEARAMMTELKEEKTKESIFRHLTFGFVGVLTLIFFVVVGASVFSTLKIKQEVEDNTAEIEDLVSLYKVRRSST